jgi:hypothetical protein
MDEAITASQLPFPKNLESGEKVDLRAAEAERKNYGISAHLLRSLAGVFTRQTQHEAILRCAEAALKVQRYRLAHKNNLPASLDETVPGILKGVPADPFHGTPLEYRRESAVSYRISSSPDNPTIKALGFRVLR